MARRKLVAAGLQAPISNDKQQLAKPTQVAAADSREEEQDWYLADRCLLGFTRRLLCLAMLPRHEAN